MLQIRRCASQKVCLWWPSPGVVSVESDDYFVVFLRSECHMHLVLSRSTCINQKILWPLATITIQTSPGRSSSHMQRRGRGTSSAGERENLGVQHRNNKADILRDMMTWWQQRKPGDSLSRWNVLLFSLVVVASYPSWSPNAHQIFYVLTSICFLRNIWMCDWSGRRSWTAKLTGHQTKEFSL